MRKIKHWFRHEWVVSPPPPLYPAVLWNTWEVEHIHCHYPGCGVRRLRDPWSGILFGPKH